MVAPALVFDHAKVLFKIAKQLAKLVFFGDCVLKDVADAGQRPLQFVLLFDDLLKVIWITPFNEFETFELKIKF